MASRHRIAIIVFALLGLGASVGALYVHYRSVTDPTYASAFCDINETVSCQQVLRSEYASVWGVPVAVGGAIWSALVLMLAAWGMRPANAEQGSRVAGYVFVLGTIALAAVFYFGYVSFFVLGQACLLCMTMYASVVGVFLVSAGAAGSLSALPSRVGKDLQTLTTSPTAAMLAVVWVLASAALVIGFPKEQVASAAEAPPAAPPLETLSADQLAEWEKWLDAQPRAQEAMPTGDAKVVVLKFNDYQCPACRQMYFLYRDIVAKYESAYPGVFKFENRDYPLETECGFGGVHGAACEAAVAARLARDKNREKEIEAALFQRQSPSMTRDDVTATLEEVAQVSRSDFDARYAQVLEAVRTDAQLGQKLGVTGTPTFFINGIRLPSLRPAYFDAAIVWALRRAGAVS